MKDKKLQKFIADTGHCSRRRAEKLIEEGKVQVNGKKAVLGMRVKDNAKVTVEGKVISLVKKNILLALNKPKGYVCTNRKVSGEKNIFDLVDLEERLFSVGRLDKNSRGLVLLTNNGDLAYKLTHPSFQHEKEYEVELDKDLDQVSQEKLCQGVDINEKTKATIKSIEKIGRKKYRVILSEGRKRQIRRMFEVFFYTVLDLKRVRIKDYKLGNLPEGKWIFLDFRDKI